MIKTKKLKKCLSLALAFSIFGQQVLYANTFQGVNNDLINFENINTQGVNNDLLQVERNTTSNSAVTVEESPISDVNSTAFTYEGSTDFAVGDISGNNINFEYTISPGQNTPDQNTSDYNNIVFEIPDTVTGFAKIVLHINDTDGVDKNYYIVADDPATTIPVYLVIDVTDCSTDVNIISNVNMSTLDISTYNTNKVDGDFNINIDSNIYNYQGLALFLDSDIQVADNINIDFKNNVITNMKVYNDHNVTNNVNILNANIKVGEYGSSNLYVDNYATSDEFNVSFKDITSEASDLDSNIITTQNSNLMFDNCDLPNTSVSFMGDDTLEKYNAEISNSTIGKLTNIHPDYNPEFFGAPSLVADINISNNSTVNNVDMSGLKGNFTIDNSIIDGDFKILNSEDSSDSNLELNIVNGSELDVTTFNISPDKAETFTTSSPYSSSKDLQYYKWDNDSIKSTVNIDNSNITINTENDSDVKQIVRLDEINITNGTTFNVSGDYNENPDFLLSANKLKITDSIFNSDNLITLTAGQAFDINKNEFNVTEHSMNILSPLLDDTSTTFNMNDNTFNIESKNDIILNIALGSLTDLGFTNHVTLPGAVPSIDALFSNNKFNLTGDSSNANQIGIGAPFTVSVDGLETGPSTGFKPQWVPSTFDIAPLKYVTYQADDVYNSEIEFDKNTFNFSNVAKPFGTTYDTDFENTADMKDEYWFNATNNWIKGADTTKLGMAKYTPYELNITTDFAYDVVISSDLLDEDITVTVDGTDTVLLPVYGDYKVTTIFESNGINKETTHDVTYAKNDFIQSLNITTEYYLKLNTDIEYEVVVSSDNLTEDITVTVDGTDTITLPTFGDYTITATPTDSTLEVQTESISIVEDNFITDFNISTPYSLNITADNEYEIVISGDNLTDNITVTVSDTGTVKLPTYGEYTITATPTDSTLTVVTGSITIEDGNFITDFNITTPYSLNITTDNEYEIVISGDNLTDDITVTINGTDTVTLPSYGEYELSATPTSSNYENQQHTLTIDENNFVTDFNIDSIDKDDNGNGNGNGNSGNGNSGNGGSTFSNLGKDKEEEKDDTTFGEIENVTDFMHNTLSDNKSLSNLIAYEVFPDTTKVVFEYSDKSLEYEANVASYIEEDTTFVGLTSLVENLYADTNVYWNNFNKKAKYVLHSEKLILEFQHNSSTFIIKDFNDNIILEDTIKLTNGETYYVKSKEGRLMIPITYLATQLGLNSVYDYEQDKVIVTGFTE